MQSQASTPKTPTPQKLAAADSDLSPFRPSKRQKVSDSPTLLARSSKARQLAINRDQSLCVLTGRADPEVAYIYPHHAIKHKEEDIYGPRHQLWMRLELFWPKEKITSWKAEIFLDTINEAGQEKVYNLVSLSPDAHSSWGNGYFALKPISMSNDKKTLTVQFFWQKMQKDPVSTISLTTLPYSTEGLDGTTAVSGGPVWLYNKDRNPIRSGDKFELTTNDPITKPLPSFELLELQWFLQRVQGMAGAEDQCWHEHWRDQDFNSVYAEAEEVPDIESNSDVEDLSLLSQ